MLHPELKLLCDRYFEAATKHSDLIPVYDKQKKSDKMLGKLFVGFIVVWGIANITIIDFSDTIDFILIMLIAIPAFIIYNKRLKAIEQMENDLVKYHNLWVTLKENLVETSDILRNKKIEQLEKDMILVNWNEKPAVVFSGSKAYVIEQPRGDWRKVDGKSVLSVGKIIPDIETFDVEFQDQYGYRRSVQELLDELVCGDESFDHQAYCDSLWKQRRET